jgi:hypothetical protein
MSDPKPSGAVLSLLEYPNAKTIMPIAVVAKLILVFIFIDFKVGVFILQFFYKATGIDKVIGRNTE